MYIKFKRTSRKISQIEITDKELIKARNDFLAIAIIGLICLMLVIALTEFYTDYTMYVLSIIFFLIPLIIGSTAIIFFYVKPDDFKKGLLKLKPATTVKKTQKQEEK